MHGSSDASTTLSSPASATASTTLSQQASHCPRCRTRLVGEVLVGRGSASETRVPRITGLTCWNCGNWIEVLPESMALPDDLKPNKLQQYLGGRPAQAVTPAIEVARLWFEEISRQRKRGIGWPTIRKLLIQATGKTFCVKSLQVHYDKELQRRTVHKEISSRAGKASARRKEAMA